MSETDRKDYTALHRAAFRRAFDLLNELWPPENTAEWFAKKAYPACAVAYDELKDNPLGMRFVEDVYWYLAEEAKRMGE